MTVSVTSAFKQDNSCKPKYSTILDSSKGERLLSYGDKFPVTTEGRIIGMVLMTAGVGLFGAFTGFISSWLNTKKTADENGESENS